MEIINAIRDVFGCVALATTIIGLIPQMYKTYSTKSARDLSLVMIWNCTICAASWMIYGFITRDKMVTISNVIALCTSIILLIQKHKYDRPA